MRTLVSNSFVSVFYFSLSYLADGWNQVDALVVVVSVLGLVYTEYQVLRALRALRPLRLAIRFEEVRARQNLLFGARLFL